MGRLILLGGMRIGTRIILTTALPIIVLIALTGNYALGKRAAAQRMAALEQLARLALPVNQFIHELQRERGRSAVFIASAGKQFEQSLAEQRKVTDESGRIFQDAVAVFTASDHSAQLAERLALVQRKTADLGSERAAVDGLELTVEQVTDFYTDSIAALLSAVEQIVWLSSDTGIGNSVKTYASLIEAKERAGLERATGAAGFAAGRFSPSIHRRFLELIGEQRAFLKEFALFASEEQKTLLASAMAIPEVAEVERMRTVALASMQTGDLAGIDAAQWFRAITVKIDRLRQVDNTLATALVARADALGSKAREEQAEAVGGLWLAVLLAGLMVFIVVRGIVKPINAITASMANIAAGHSREIIPAVDRQDEIGAMARVFRDLIERLDLSNRDSARLRSFIQEAPAAIAMFDRNMHYVAVSKRWMGDYGLRESVIGRSHYEIFPDVPETWKAAHRRGLDGEVIKEEEDGFERNGAPTIWLKWEIRPWYVADGSVGGIVIFTEDITQRKAAELARDAGVCALEESNRELDEFAHIVSHDLKEPLRGLRNQASFLQEDFGNALPEEAVARLTRMNALGERMQHLIDDLLFFSRLGRGELAI